MVVTMDAVFAELSEIVGASLVGDPYPIFAERRASTPVMAGDIMAEFGLPSMAQSIDGSRPMFTLFRYDDIVAALRDARTFSSSVILEVFEPLMGRVVLGLDGEEHRSWRGLLVPAFSKRLVDMWQAQIVRPVARRLAEDLARSGKRANLVDFGLRYPVRMVYEILGFPSDDEASYNRFATAGLTMLVALQGMNPSNPQETARAVGRAIEASQQIYASVLPVVQRRRAAGSEGDDFIGHLLRAEFEGARFEDDQITVFVRSLLPAAAETTTRNWLNAMTCILQRPEVLEEIRADRSLIGQAIDEGMRLETATTVLGRITTREIDLRGVRVPAGAGITLCVASGNRDESVFENPDTYDLHRAGRIALGFGFGPHVCAGMNTSKVEMREATEALIDTLPNLRLPPDAPPPAIRGVMMRSPATLPVIWN